MMGLKNFILQHYKKANNQLYISFEDAVIEAVLGSEKLNIKKDQNIDQFAFKCYTSNDIDILFVCFWGNQTDSGLLSLFCPNIVRSETNIISILSSIFNQQPAFDKNLIIETIATNIQAATASLAQKTNIMYDKNNLIFSFKNLSKKFN